MTTTRTTRPKSDLLMAPSSILPADIMHRAAAKTFLNETQEIPQVPDTFPPVPLVGTAFLDPLPEGKSHRGEPRGNKVLSVRSAFIFIRPDETDFKELPHVGGTYSHLRCGVPSHTANRDKQGLKKSYSTAAGPTYLQNSC